MALGIGLGQGDSRAGSTAPRRVCRSEAEEPIGIQTSSRRLRFATCCIDMPCKRSPEEISPETPFSKCQTDLWCVRPGDFLTTESVVKANGTIIEDFKRQVPRWF